MTSITFDGFLSFKVTLRAKRYCVLRGNQLSFYPDPNGWALSPVGARSEGTLEVVSVSHWDGRRVGSVLFRSHDHAFKLRVRQQSASLHRPLNEHLMEANSTPALGRDDDGTEAGYGATLQYAAHNSASPAQKVVAQQVLELNVVVDSADSKRRWMAALQHNCGHRVLSTAQMQELRLHHGLQGPQEAAAEAETAVAAELPADGTLGSSCVLGLIQQPVHGRQDAPISAAAVGRDATLHASASTDDMSPHSTGSSPTPRSISTSVLVSNVSSRWVPKSRWFKLPHSYGGDEHAGVSNAADAQSHERRLSASEHEVGELEGNGHWHLNGNAVDIIDDFYTRQGGTSSIAARSRNGKCSRSHSEAIFDVPVGLGMRVNSLPRSMSCNSSSGNMDSSNEDASWPLRPPSPPSAMAEPTASTCTQPSYMLGASRDDLDLGFERQCYDHSFVASPIWRSLSGSTHSPGLRQRSASAPAALTPSANVKGQSDDTPSFVEIGGTTNDTGSDRDAGARSSASVNVIGADDDAGADASANLDPSSFSQIDCDSQRAQNARALLRGLPSMRIVFMIVGSRGDVQPFIVWAKELKSAGHRPRIATHALFEDWVRGHGIDFFPVAGDPHKLMEVMVESNILSPRQLSGVGWKRAFIRQLLVDNWHACTQSEPARTPTVSDGDGDEEGGSGEVTDGKCDSKLSQGRESYRADLIIANPPSFAAPHIAERLGLPLHMAFTMPWTRTQAVQHPLITAPMPTRRARAMSYSVVDRLMWLAFSDIIDDWRGATLGLLPVRASGFSGARLLTQREVPFIYAFSQHLLPKPTDWPNYVDVTGFLFLDNPDTGWKPPEDLRAFLAAIDPDTGQPLPKPVFVGFGSIVVQRPAELTQLVLEAVRIAGVRAIIQCGWADLTNGVTLPDTVMAIGRAPHDWLFERCAAVVHHGGAGTTAAGLRAGLPSVILPFFGDQFFWAGAVASRGAGSGPKVLPCYRNGLTAAKLGQAISQALAPAACSAAMSIGKALRAEDSAGLACAAMIAALPHSYMRCAICEANFDTSAGGATSMESGRGTEADTESGAGAGADVGANDVLCATESAGNGSGQRPGLATVYCRACEAAICADCDRKLHGAPQVLASRYCANHADGKTMSKVVCFHPDCVEAGRKAADADAKVRAALGLAPRPRYGVVGTSGRALCAACDQTLHLSPAAAAHPRKVIEEHNRWELRYVDWSVSPPQFGHFLGRPLGLYVCNDGHACKSDSAEVTYMQSITPSESELKCPPCEYVRVHESSLSQS